MIKVNLVPQEILDKEAQKQQALQVGVVMGVFVLVLAGVSFGHYYKKVKLVKELAEMEAQLKKLEVIVQQVEALEAKASAVRARLNVMEDLIKSRELYPGFMTDLLKTFPPGVWLTSLTTTGAGKGLTVSMGAMARTPEDVSEWLRTLQKSERFSNPTIGAINMGAAGGNSFAMNAVYAPPAAK